MNESGTSEKMNESGTSEKMNESETSEVERGEKMEAIFEDFSCRLEDNCFKIRGKDVAGCEQNLSFLLDGSGPYRMFNYYFTDSTFELFYQAQGLPESMTFERYSESAEWFGRKVNMGEISVIEEKISEKEVSMRFIRRGPMTLVKWRATKEDLGREEFKSLMRNHPPAFFSNLKTGGK